MQRSRLLLASTALLFSACAATTPKTSAPAPVEQVPEPVVASLAPVPAPPEPPARTCDMFVKPGVLRRASLVRLIDAGLPLWLQGVNGDRMLANRHFQGWQVLSLHPDDPCYRDVDLRRGDVVQKVNGPVPAGRAGHRRRVLARRQAPPVHHPNFGRLVLRPAEEEVRSLSLLFGGRLLGRRFLLGRLLGNGRVGFAVDTTNAGVGGASGEAKTKSRALALG